MASKKAQFKARLQENQGKSLDGKKLFGRMEKLTYKSVDVWSDDKFIHVDIKSPEVSDYDKHDLQNQCKSLLEFIDDFKEGENICLSQVCNSIFDLKVMFANIVDGKQHYKCVTL